MNNALAFLLLAAPLFAAEKPTTSIQPTPPLRVPRNHRPHHLRRTLRPRPQLDFEYRKYLDTLGPTLNLTRIFTGAYREFPGDSTSTATPSPPSPAATSPPGPKPTTASGTCPNGIPPTSHASRISSPRPPNAASSLRSPSSPPITMSTAGRSVRFTSNATSTASATPHLTNR